MLNIGWVYLLPLKNNCAQDVFGLGWSDIYKVFN